MKKIISFALAIMLIATMSVTAFAAEDTSPTTINKDGNSASIPVKGTYKSAATGENISVVVEWKDMEFTYTTGGWNTTTHQYDTTGSWSTNKGTITITNNSDVAVTATLKWKQNEDLFGIILGEFTGDDVKDGNVLELESANNSAYLNKTGPQATAQFGIDGDSDPIAESDESLGTITVTIAKKASN